LVRIAIEGGHPLTGIFQPSGNKNAAIPILAASLLVPGITTTCNIPWTVEINRMLEGIEWLGFRYQKYGDQIEIHPSVPAKNSIPHELLLSPQIALLFSPLLLKQGSVVFEQVDLTKERISTHLSVLDQFGVTITTDTQGLHLKQNRMLINSEVMLEEASVTATELAILMALSTATTVITNAACEPHVVDLVKFLNQCGADIKGIGSNQLAIHGNLPLSGTNYRIASDHIEIGSMIMMTAMTGGTIQVEDYVPETIRPILNQLKKFGIQSSFDSARLVILPNSTLTVKNTWGSGQLKFSSPWPGFPSDLLPLVAVLATQANGSTILHEKMYDSRMYFLDSLVSMGARAIQCDPHRAVISGATRLVATYLETPDIRTGLALLGAALVAQGTSIIDESQIINRIFHNPIEKLKKLGAEIQVIQ
jgi:UDP-N-acetylglucosamine 1-carboxyvinyltransferase